VTVAALPRRLALSLAGASLAVASAGGALAAVGTTKLSRDAALDHARAQALAAAQQIAVDFSAYDYRHIDADFARVAAESTGSFRTEYLTQSAGVKSLIIQVKAVSTTEVAGAAVADATTHRATVVLALNRTVTNTKAPNGQRDSFGLELIVVHKGGRWLAEQVKPL
jgi:Mce-associated membrane protein